MDRPLAAKRGHAHLTDVAEKQKNETGAHNKRPKKAPTINHDDDDNDFRFYSTMNCLLCVQCKEVKDKLSFSKNQKRKGPQAKCKDCTNGCTASIAKVVTPPPPPQPPKVLSCSKCQKEKQREGFSQKQWKQGNKEAGKAMCTECNQPPEPPLVLTCFKCQKEKQQDAFSQNQWKHGIKDADKAFCTDCSYQPEPDYICCAVCKTSKRKSLSNFTKKERAKAQNGSEDITCKECMAQERKEKERAAEEQRRVWREERRVEQEERDRKLALPRKCSVCGESKPKEDYSTHQWSTEYYDKEQTCLACYPLKKELADIKEEGRQAKLAWRRQNWNRCKGEFTELATKGVFVYHFDHKTVTTREPETAQLEGSYSIIFHHGYCDCNQDKVSRTARGTLTFATDPETRKLVGQIEFDENFPAGISYTFNPTYKIAPLDDGALVPVGGRFIVEDLVDPHGVINEDGEDQHALLTVVNKRVALPWKPTEECDYFNLKNKFEVDKLVKKFRSLEEAEALMKRHNKLTPPDWISNHLGLGEEIAKHIYEYIPMVPHSRRPPPVFFLEPGDLCLHTKWYTDHHAGDAASYIIARKMEP